MTAQIDYMKTFEEAAQAVWTATSLTDKKNLLREMVESFAAKGKEGANVIKFNRSIDALTSTRRADDMAAQLTLFVGNAVIK